MNFDLMSMQPAMRQSLSKRISALLLFLVAPFVAEYLLGDLPLRLIPAMVVLAPMYGGAALLIRETARRRHRSWSNILLFAVAYALLEEGLITQSLFDPDYLSLHAQLLRPAHISWLGTGGWWLILMLNLHVFWSIAVPIVLVESLERKTASKPWLGRVGLSVAVVVFVAGIAANGVIARHQTHFRAEPYQVIAVATACGVAVVAALTGRRRERTEVYSQRLPSWAFASAGLFFGVVLRVIPPGWGWGAVVAIAGLDLMLLFGLEVLARRGLVSRCQLFGLAAGGALAYGVRAFWQAPLMQVNRTSAFAGHVLFLTLAVALIAAGAQAFKRV